MQIRKVEVYSGLYRISKMEFFAKIIKALNIFTKSSILDTCFGPKYTSTKNVSMVYLLIWSIFSITWVALRSIKI